MHTRIRKARLIVLAASVIASLAIAVTSKGTTGPDLTKVFPTDAKGTYNLGPTGLQGWMHFEWQRRVPGDMTLTPLTVDTRQIYVTSVEEGSPADGVIQVGDVLLGIGDKPFEGDPRVALADAINEAEKVENGGSLKLLLWRPDEPDKEGAESRAPGRTRVQELKLKVLGSYSDTAPYNCEKSDAILKQTIDAMLKRISPNLDLPYLALLATGEEEHLEIVKSHVLSVASSVPEPSLESVDKAHTWNTGYRLILLCEYYLISKDESVLPAIRNTAVTLSMGQSITGTWGHRMAAPSGNDGRLHGRLGGYADLNQPSVACFLGLALARKCGVEHPELTTALDKVSYFFGHFTGKGAIPYGYGPPKEYMQSNNGTSGSAALAFAMQGDKESARFFSRMSVGASPKLEVGHVGPFFNTMWTGLGANVSGPSAYAEFFKRWTWLRTLTRKWDGGFVYLKPGSVSSSFRGVSPDAAMVLHFALPRRKLLVTGREQDESLWLEGKAAEAAADVWAIDYEGATDGALLKLLDHEIPMVRGFAAGELAKRGDDTINTLRHLLKGSRNEKIGACNALANMQEEATPALDDLMALARAEAESPWVRSRALKALAAMGAVARARVPELLNILITDCPNDPRRDFERYGAPYVLSMMKQSSFDVASHKDSVYPSALKLIAHPHSVTRKDGMAMIEDLGVEDLHRFADRIVENIRNNNPEYTSYTDDRPRKMGLAILERLNISDGIPLAVETIEPERWGYWRRLNYRMAFLQKYGIAAKPYLPKLRASLREKDKDHDGLKKIENATVTRELITLEQAKNVKRKQ